MGRTESSVIEKHRVRWTVTDKPFAGGHLQPDEHPVTQFLCPRQHHQTGCCRLNVVRSIRFGRRTNKTTMAPTTVSSVIPIRIS